MAPWRVLVYDEAKPLDDADLLLVFVGDDQPLLDLEQAQHEYKPHGGIDKAEYAVRHIFSALFGEYALDDVAQHVHHRRREADDQPYRRPYVGALLLVGGDDPGQHIICVLEEVPKYQRRDAGAVRIDDALALLSVMRLPCREDRKHRKKGRQKQYERLVTSEPRIGVLQQFAEKRLYDQTRHAGDKTYPRAVYDVEVVDRRDLRRGDEPRHDRDDGTHTERAAAETQYLLQIEIPALGRRLPKDLVRLRKLFDLLFEVGGLAVAVAHDLPSLVVSAQCF